MKYILNEKQRNQAFIQFFIFFLVTVLLITGTVYFNFRVPVKENEALFEQVTLDAAANMQEEKFLSKFDDVKIYLDSPDRNGTDILNVEREIEKKLQALGALERNPNVIYEKMNATVSELLVDIHNTRKSLRVADEKAKKAAEFENDYKECQNNLDKFRQKTDIP